MPTTRPHSDYFGYISIGLLVVLGGILIATYTSEGMASRLMRWVGLAVATAVEFGYVANWFASELKHFKLRLVFLFLIAIHLTVYSCALTMIDRWPLSLFAILALPEWILIQCMLEWASKKTKAGHLSRKAS